MTASDVNNSPWEVSARLLASRRESARSERMRKDLRNERQRIRYQKRAAEIARSESELAAALYKMRTGEVLQ